MCSHKVKLKKYISLIIKKKPLKFPLSIMSGSKYLLNVTPDIKSVKRHAVK